MARKMTRTALELERAGRSAARAGAQAYKRVIESEIRQVVGADLRMSGVGKNGARVGVRYDVRDDNHGSTALIKAMGPLHLVERDTKAHLIESTRADWDDDAALLLPDGNFRRAVPHRGTKGRHPFAKGVTKGKPAAGRAMKTPMVAAARKGIRS